MDPATLYAIGKVGGFVMDAMDQKRTSDAADAMMKTIEESAGKFLDQSEDMMSIARYFQPGGGAFRDAKQTAIDTAFMTAQKGSEDLMAKGVNMTSYGMGTAADIIKDTFTKNLMSDYKELSSIGVDYSRLGQDALKTYADYMTTGAQAEFIGATSGTNPFASIFSDLGTMEGATAISSFFGSGGADMSGANMSYGELYQDTLDAGFEPVL